MGMDTKEAAAALDLKFNSNDLGKTTVRLYLKELLKTLLNEGESFSGKRPFGNSGWEWDLAGPLIKAGILKGELDEGDRAESFDDLEYSDCLDALVEAL